MYPLHKNEFNLNPIIIVKNFDKYEIRDLMNKSTKVSFEKVKNYFTEKQVKKHFPNFSELPHETFTTSTINTSEIPFSQCKDIVGKLKEDIKKLEGLSVIECQLPTLKRDKLDEEKLVRCFKQKLELSLQNPSQFNIKSDIKKPIVPIELDCRVQNEQDESNIILMVKKDQERDTSDIVTSLIKMFRHVNQTVLDLFVPDE